MDDVVVERRDCILKRDFSGMRSFNSAMWEELKDRIPDKSRSRMHSLLSATTSSISQFAAKLDVPAELSVVGSIKCGPFVIHEVFCGSRMERNVGEAGRL